MWSRIRHLLRRVLTKLLSPVVRFGSVTFFARDLAGVIPKTEAAIPLTLRFAARADLTRLEASRSAAVHDRFRRGHKCVLAIDLEEQLAHSRWLATSRCHIPELDAELELAAGDAYFYDGFTDPQFRGLNVDGAVRCFIFSEMQKAGCSRVLSYVRGDNPAGLRAAARWQSKLGVVRYLKVRGLRAILFGDRAPGIPALTPSDDAGRPDRESRWRSWFEGWISQPMHVRSTGFNGQPEAYFVSVAAYITAALDIQADRDVVLDLGCDSAMVSRLVAPGAHQFVGVDFIPAMLAQIPRDSVRTATGTSASIVGADGRLLPFAAGSFTKAYCSAVIHTLPSKQDGLAMIDELIRVCRPGGKVLIASVPDTAKRALRSRLANLTPAVVRQAVRRLRGLPPRDLVSLEYDLAAIKRRLERRGLSCRILHYPSDYWSVDFRRTRSNLLIELPGAPAPQTEADFAGSAPDPLR